MNTKVSKNQKWVKTLGILSIIIGSLLLFYMIKFEDEPGALPLFLIILGIAHMIINSYKRRQKQP